MSQSTKSFKEIEASFAHWLRMGNGPPPEEFDPERIQIYRRLVVGNIRGLLANYLPRLFRLLGFEEFNRVVEAYIRSKYARTCYFNLMAGEFTQWFFENDSLDLKADLALARELAHYDWLRGMLDTQPDPVGEKAVHADNLISIPKTQQQNIKLSQEASIVGYTHRVYLKYPKCNARADTFLLLHRNKLGDVRWNLIDPLTARIGALLQKAREDEKGTTVSAIETILEQEFKSDVVDLPSIESVAARSAQFTNTSSNGSDPSKTVKQRITEAFKRYTDLSLIVLDAPQKNRE